MGAYILRRLALMIPTLLGILLLNFIIIQSAPGGPVDQVLARLSAMSQAHPGQVAAARPVGGSAITGVDPAYIKQLDHQFGFDRPMWERFLIMVKNYCTFDFGNSFFQGGTVAHLILTRLPVTISIGFWSMLLMYVIAVPLGIKQAVRYGSRYDRYTSALVIIGYAIPAFLWALLFIFFFAGGQYFTWFPLRGLVSSNFEQLSLIGKILDYFHHIALPVLAYAVSSFAVLSLLTKNSFLNEIHSQYVLTARAKGASEKRILYRHIFRNAMLIVISGLPSTMVAILIGGSILIEKMFSLNGLGLLGLTALQQRDYPVIFGTLFIFSLLTLVAQLVSDLMYTWIDPRIDFEARK